MTTLTAVTRVAALLVVTLAMATATLTVDSGEHKVLLELLAKTEHPHESWQRSADPCTEWEGVLCVGGGHVNRIRAHDMGVTALPEDIGKLSHLVHLSVRGGRVERVPLSLFDLRKLRHLDLHDNALGKLADEFDVLTKLRHLDLSNNALTKLPASIGALAQLRTLNVARNAELHPLPTTLGALAALEFLDVSGCGLTTLPAGVGTLPSLLDLVAADNKLATLPSLSGLTQLDAIELSNNAFVGVPETLCTLPQLRSVALSFNPIGTLPACVGQWTALEEFIAESAEITALPSALFSLSVTHIHLHDNKLATLDAGVCKLPLQVLEVSYNELTSVPACLGGVASLKELSLVGNADLEAVPASLHHLTGDVVAAHAIHVSGSTVQVDGDNAAITAAAGAPAAAKGAKSTGEGGTRVTTATPTPTPEAKVFEGVPDATAKYAVHGGDSPAGAQYRSEKKKGGSKPADAKKAEQKKDEKKKDEKKKDEKKKSGGWFSGLF